MRDWGREWEREIWESCPGRLNGFMDGILIETGIGMVERSCIILVQQ